MHPFNVVKQDAVMDDEESWDEEELSYSGVHLRADTIPWGIRMMLRMLSINV